MGFNTKEVRKSIVDEGAPKKRKQRYIVEVELGLKIRPLYESSNPLSQATQIREWENKYGWMLSKAGTEIRRRITEEIN